MSAIVLALCARRGGCGVCAGDDRHPDGQADRRSGPRPAGRDRDRHRHTGRAVVRHRRRRPLPGPVPRPRRLRRARRAAGLQGRRAEGRPRQPRPDHLGHAEARGRRHHRDRVGRRHLDHRQHVVDHDRRGAVERAAGRPSRSAGASPTRCTWRRASAAAARWARANPSVSGGSGLDNLYVVDGVNVTNTGYGAVGSYSIIFGSLGTATPFDFIKEIQVKTGGYEAEYGQSMGGVVNVVTKSGTNDLRGSLFGYAQTDELEAGVEDLPVGQRHGEHGGHRALRRRHRRRLPDRPQPAVLLRRHQPGLGEAHLHRPRRLPAAQPGRGRSRARSRCPTPARPPGRWPRRTASTRRSSATRPRATWAAAHLVAARHRHVVVQRARVRRPQPDRALRRRPVAEPARRSQRRPRLQQDRRDARRSTPGASPTRRSCPTSSPAASAPTSRATRARTSSTPPRPPGWPAATQVKVGGLFEDVEYTQVNQHTGPTFTAATGQQTETGASVSIIADPTFGRIYRVTRANFNSARTTTQDYWSLLPPGHLAGQRSPDHQPGPPLRAADAARARSRR